MMKTISAWTVVAVALLAPAAAFAQSSDAAYCSALAAKYEKYLNQDVHRGGQPQSLEARNSLEQCKAGNPTGIAGLEKALKDAGYALPPRG